MIKKRTKAFADRLVANPAISQTQAYIDTHDTDNRLQARVRASELANKPEVITYMSQHRQLAEKTIVQVMKNANKRDKRDNHQWQRLAADTADKLLDRVDGKPVTKSINANIGLSTEDLLAMLK